MMKKFLPFLCVGVPLLLMAAASVCYALFFTEPAAVCDTRINGKHLGSQLWSGTITVTGDTVIIGNLTILPGTVVLFELGDDQHSGGEVGPDGFNDEDPTRFKAYTQTHAELNVVGKLIAKGTPDQRILFSSASAHPTYADWQGVCFLGDGSCLEYITMEYARNGIAPKGNQPHSVVRNSIFRHIFWGGIGLGKSSMQALDNEVSDCGHEGIDVQDGNSMIKNNTIRDCHAGIVIVAGSPIIENNIIRDCGDGIHAEPGATPTLINNSVSLCSEGTEREWRYKNFSYGNNRSPGFD